MFRRIAALAFAVSIWSTANVGAQKAPGSIAGAGEWTAYGRDALGSRFSPLTQITRENVGSLAVAWTYRTGELSVTTRQPTKFEATPLMVDGTLFLSTPLGQVVALDPETGKARWTFDAKADARVNWGDFANRGVSTWLDAKAPAGALCRRRIYLGTIDARIIALDSKTGKPCVSFGEKGTIDLRRGLRNAPIETAEYEPHSPPGGRNGT